MDDLLGQLKTNDSAIQDKLKRATDVDSVCKILKAYEAELDVKIKELESASDPQRLLDELQRYNDIKDFTEEVIGRFAEHLGVPIAEIHQKYSPNEK